MHSDTLQDLSYPLARGTASLSEPRLVARKKGHLWFPTVFRRADGELVAVMQTYADIHTRENRWMLATSRDDGLTWAVHPEQTRHSIALHLPQTTGDALLLPYYFFPGMGGMHAPGYRIPVGSAKPAPLPEKVTVTGWPRPVGGIGEPELGFAGFVANRQWLRLQDGRYLATYYGYFAGTERFSLVAAVSADGVHWEICATIADEQCPLDGQEGPCEAALCRQRDGRILCVFRLGMAPGGTRYGQTWSADEGKTWAPPVAMQPGLCSVEPSLAALPDGTLVLSGGRPGLYCWIDRTGDGLDWGRIDLLEHHNRFHPRESMRYTEEFGGYQTTAYTETIVLDDTTLLCIYDRIPYGWAVVPEESIESNSNWVVRIRIA